MIGICLNQHLRHSGFLTSSHLPLDVSSQNEEQARTPTEAAFCAALADECHSISAHLLRIEEHIHSAPSHDGRTTLLQLEAALEVSLNTAYPGPIAHLSVWHSEILLYMRMRVASGLSVRAALLCFRCTIAAPCRSLSAA